MTGGLMVVVLVLLFAALVVNTEVPDLFDGIMELLKGAKEE